MKQLYTLVLLLILSGTTLFAQEPLTDKILIEFMAPGDPDAQARDYNLLPWPEEAKAAAYKAAEIWASYLEITVPIRVKFGWCDNIDEAAIGSPTYTYQYTDGFYYPLSIINQLLGYDRNTSVVDIICVFKSNLNMGWYFGIDGEIGLTPSPDDPGAHFFQKDFLTVALHEICHGLGFSSTMSVTNNEGKWGGVTSGKANIYDTFLVNHDGIQLIDEDIIPNHSHELANILTSDNLYWNGKKAIAADDNNIVKIHAPNIWKQRNSIGHIDGIYSNTENSLMSGLGIEGGTHQHSVGPVILGMLQDIGWSLKSGATANDKIQIESSVKVYTTGKDIIVEGAKANDRVLVCDFSGRVRYTGYGSGSISLNSGLYIVRVADRSFKIRL